MEKVYIFLLEPWHGELRETEGKAGMPVPCVDADCSEKPSGGWVEHASAGASTLIGLCWEMIMIPALLQPGEMQWLNAHSGGWHLCVVMHVTASGINWAFPSCVRLTGTHSDQSHALAHVTSCLWRQCSQRFQENASQLCTAWREDSNGNRAWKPSPPTEGNSRRSSREQWVSWPPGMHSLLVTIPLSGESLV